MTGITVPATLLARADEVIDKTAHVGSWHKPDQSGWSRDVRFWGKTGSRGPNVKPTRMTLAV